MIDRREFLRRSGLIAAGVVAADQLELLERLMHKKVFTTGGYDPLYYYFSFDVESKPLVSTYTLPSGREVTAYWRNPCPVVVPIRRSEYIRRFGLEGHTLAFDSEGKWLVPPETADPIFPKMQDWRDTCFIGRRHV